MAAISFQQNIVRVVHLEVVQGGPLNTLIPNTCLQQPMSGKPGLPPRYYALERKFRDENGGLSSSTYPICTWHVWKGHPALPGTKITTLPRKCPIYSNYNVLAAILDALLSISPIQKSNLLYFSMLFRLSNNISNSAENRWKTFCSKFWGLNCKLNRLINIQVDTGSVNQGTARGPET